MARWKTVTGLGIALILVCMGVRASGVVLVFVDLPSMIFVAGIALPLTLIRGWSWRRLRHLLVIVGGIGTMIGLISTLQTLGDQNTLGPRIATAMITLFYGLIGAAVCRAFEVENSEAGEVVKPCC